MNLRCFIAVGIPESIKKGIGVLIDILKKHEVDVKWIIPENLHLTLKFLGGTPDDLISGIGKSLSAVVSSYAPFYIKIYSTGVFPSKKYPRVIWVGMEDSEVLRKLHGDIEDEMSGLGYKKEGKDFRPHLTIGRVRSQKGMMNIINEIENFKDKDFGTITVDSIKLMKSELKPKGAEYTCLQDFPFERK
jgi:2'-5' RNA ligase